MLGHLSSATILCVSPAAGYKKKECLFVKTLTEVLQDWEAVIGLEIHTELTTLNSKMFCSCKLSHEDEPNTNVCPVCLGLPGALPVPNKQAIESIVLAGLATNCAIEKETMFYRKNYFYPDMAKNFQTTQGPLAFCMRGYLDLELDAKAAQERVDLDKNADGGYSTRIGITRIHMEEDAGKLVHVGGVDGRISGAQYSVIDYNRCGMPLIELVTEPEIRTPEEARLFMQKLREIFLYLGISDCSMESGSMRCDGNVSLRRRGEQGFGVKTELKNMNSFKNLHDGLAYEICRQAEVLEQGGEIYQETRHWEPSHKRTVIMRTKETADDYRLFPEPDLAPYILTDEFIAELSKRLPELPQQKQRRYQRDFSLSVADASYLAADKKIAEYFDTLMSELACEQDFQPAAFAKQAANLIINDVAGYLNARNQSFHELELPVNFMRELVTLMVKEEISSKQAKEVFELMLKEVKSPYLIVEERQMKQLSDSSALEPLVRAVLEACPDQVQQFKDGNEKVIGFLTGQCMKVSKGQGNPKVMNELLRKLLQEM